MVHNFCWGSTAFVRRLLRCWLRDISFAVKPPKLAGTRSFGRIYIWNHFCCEQKQWALLLGKVNTYSVVVKQPWWHPKLGGVPARLLKFAGIGGSRDYFEKEFSQSIGRQLHSNHTQQWTPQLMIGKSSTNGGFSSHLGWCQSCSAFSAGMTYIMRNPGCWAALLTSWKKTCLSMTTSALWVKN